MRSIVAVFVILCIAVGHAGAQIPGEALSGAALAESKRVADVWESHLQEQRLRMIKEIPELKAPTPFADDLIKSTQELDGLKKDRDSVSSRIAENQKKGGATAEFFIKKDKERLKPLEKRIDLLETKVATLKKSAVEERSRAEAMSSKLNAANMKRIDEQIAEMRFDETKFLPLNDESMKTGQFGRILPFDMASMRKLRIDERRIAIPLLQKVDAGEKLDARRKEALRRIFGVAPTDAKTNVTILQVIDEHNAIVFPTFTAGPSARFMWVEFDTRGATDNSQLLLEGTFIVLGTKTYTTKDGGSNTIPHLMKVDLKALMAKIESAN